MKSALALTTLVIAAVDNVCGQFAPPFVPTELACSMAHCDSQMTDNGHMVVPEGDDVNAKIDVIWTDMDPAGSPFMIGCVSNRHIGVCSFGPIGLPPYLKAYNGDGDVLWSFTGIGPLASASAPMIDDLGRVVANDGRGVYMLDLKGKLLWEVRLPGGIPISLVRTDNGLLVLCTTEGWVVSIDPTTGQKVAQMQLTGRVNWKGGRFRTRNTPTVIGNRMYTVNEFAPWIGTDYTNTGRMFAIDVSKSGTNKLQIKWTLDFGARSGASPTVVDGLIWFDADFPNPGWQGFNPPDLDPHFLVVKDNGSSGSYVSKIPVSRRIRASPAADPDGRGVWAMTGSNLLNLMNKEGEIVDQLDLLDYDHLGDIDFIGICTIGYRNVTNSTNQQEEHPVIMCPAGKVFTDEDVTIRDNPQFQVGIDLYNKELVFYAMTGETMLSWSTCQAATILDSCNQPVVILSTALNGVVGVGNKCDRSSGK